MDVDEEAISLHVEQPRQMYTVTKSLRRTLFGKAYAAIDRATGQPVALKLSNRHLLSQGVTSDGVHVLENPHDEIDIMRRLQANGTHRNVITFLREHYEKEWHWMVLEFAAHGELFDILSAQQIFSEQQAKFWLRQIVKGVDHIHQSGVAHLDLSLENVLVSDNNEAKICDFGVAKPISPFGMFAPCGDDKPGKSRYMAPEIYNSEAFDGQKADLWSLGVMLYCMVTGSACWEAPSRSDERYSFFADTSIRGLLQAFQISNLSEGCVDLLERLLTVDAAKRITMPELLAHPWLTTNHI